MKTMAEETTRELDVISIGSTQSSVETACSEIIYISDTDVCSTESDSSSSCMSEPPWYSQKTINTDFPCLSEAKTNNAVPGDISTIPDDNNLLVAKVDQNVRTQPIDLFHSGDEDTVPLAEKLRSRFQVKPGSTAWQLLQHNVGSQGCEDRIPTTPDFTNLTENDRNEDLPDLEDMYCSSRDVPSSIMSCSSSTSGISSNTEDTLSQNYVITSKCHQQKIDLAAEEKAEKARQKQLKRQEKQRQKEIARTLKKAEQELRRDAKPEESIKLVQITLDSHLLELSGAGEMLGTLQSRGLEYTLTQQPVPNTITWTHDVRNVDVDNSGQILSTTVSQKADQAIVVLLRSDFVQMVHEFKEQQKGSLATHTTLTQYASHMQAILSGTRITYVVIGMERYFRDQMNRRNRQFKATVQGDHEGTNNKCQRITVSGPQVSRVEMEEATVDMLIMADTDLHMVECMSDLGDLIAQFTRAIAAAPHKQQKLQGQYAWLADNDNWHPAKVNKNGIGLLQLWQQQIQQIHLVGKDVAQAVVAHYPSPRLLLRAYGKCKTKQEAQLLLKDILVRRGIGRLTTSRHVGPELSRKMHVLFTAQDGAALLHRS